MKIGRSGPPLSRGTALPGRVGPRASLVADAERAGGLGDLEPSASPELLSQELWALFDELMDAAPEERRRRLEEVAARDAELGRELEELLRSDEAGLSVLDRSPVARAKVGAPPSFAPGSVLADRFEVIRLLGAGGAGEVYEVVDRELDRRVALKSMHSWVAEDPIALARFRQEIQLAQKVTHRNVCRAYDLVREGDRYFVTMELLQGRTLTEVLRGGERLGLSDSLEIVQQVAQALDASHAAGIVHRDLKPDNVLLVEDATGPRAVVTDFGIATLTADPSSLEAGAQLTEMGTTVGTPAYMAPEQLESATVSPATDVYALGLLLFEMVTGTRPFSGRTSFAEAHKRLEGPAPAPRERVPDLDPRWDRVIRRCLEPRPEDRFQSPGEVARALADPTLTVKPPTAVRRRRRRAAAVAALIALGAVGIWLQTGVRDFEPRSGGTTLAAASPSPTSLTGTWADAVDPRSVAVLPFVNSSADPDQEYFADGISEELLHRLAGIPELRVTSRSSSFSFKGRGLRLDEIAERLGVAHLLEGSVRTAGDEVRVTAQLIDARTDTHLWSGQWDRQREDLFTIQDEIARAVASELAVTLLGSVREAQSVDPKAYTLVLRARQLWRELDPNRLPEILELYRQALQIVPEYAPAWIGLADVYSEQARQGQRPADEGHRLAREAAERAIELEPDNALAHRKLALTAGTGNYVEAVPHMLRALALAPSDPRVLGGAAALARSLGRLDEAVALAELRVAIDPLNASPHLWLGRYYYLAGRYGDAKTSYQTAVALKPDLGAAHAGIAKALLAEGDPEAALSALEKEPDQAVRLEAAALVLHSLGRDEESRAALAELIEGFGDSLGFRIACVFAQRGEVERAFEWLDRTVELGEEALSGLHTEPFLEPLYDDPRWLPLLRRFNKAPDQLAAFPFEARLARR